MNIRLKIVFLFSVVVFFFAGKLLANQHELFLRATKYLEHQDYKAAVELYEKIDPKGVAVLYNLGICYEATGEPIRARACWLRAYKMASYQEKQKLKSLIDRVQLETDKKAQSWIEKIVFTARAIYAGCSLFALQLLFILIWLLYLAFLWRRKKKYRFLQCMLVVLMIGMMVKYDEVSSLYAIVIAPESSVFVGPDATYQEVCAINEGDLVAIVDSRNGWHKVRTNNGVGWILAEKIYQI